MDFDDDLLIDLLQTLDAPQARFAELERYYSGTQALAFLSPASRSALGNRLDRMATNLPRLAVASLAERLRVTGFTGDPNVWPLWLANDLDQLSAVAHREALLLGSSFIVCWTDKRGNPCASIESAKQVAVLADPGTREITSAVKRWRTRTTTESILYQPDQITRLRADTPGAATTGFYVIDQFDNPLGVVPVVQLRNTERIPVGMVSYPDRLLEFGSSEIHDLMPLVDGINKILADLMVAAEYTARPRRWATGIEMVERPKLDDAGNPVLDSDNEPIMETVNPFPEGNRMMIAEPEAARIGQLDGANLAGYRAAVDILLSQVMACSALPAHFVGITTSNPASADALRAAESSLTARAESRQQTLGRAWEQVGRLLVATQNGVDPSDVDCHVKWAPADTRSIAQEADAVTKLYAAKLLSREGALRRLGFTEDEIIAELAAKSAEVQNEDPMGVFYSSQIK
jgi:Phage portal protein, SPP1 Gp6-like